MKKLHMMVGLPRSGKSTVARSLGYPIVNPDSIRLSLHGTAFRKEAEPMVWAIAHTMVESLFLAGHDDVILDACSHTKHRRNEWNSNEWGRVFHILFTTKETCTERASVTQQQYLIPVIAKMNQELAFPDLYAEGGGQVEYHYAKEKTGN